MPSPAPLPPERLSAASPDCSPAGPLADREATVRYPRPATGFSASECEALVRVIEAAPQVRRRHQFFIWSQGSLQSLLPHQVAACGAYQRQRKELVYDAFHSVVLLGAVLELLKDGRSPLMRGISAAWVDGGGRALRIELARPAPAVANAAAEPAAAQRALLRGCGVEHLLVHGVSRPQRPNEIESLFVFASPAARSTPLHLLHLELLLPLLHSTWRRVQGLEGALRGPGATARQGPANHALSALSARERQILARLCEGLSNQQVGERLGISPLTVKNHVQSILRKLGVANRTQAVASALSLDLLQSSADAPLR